MAFTFKGGVHPAEMKELSEKSALRRAPVPEKVYIPLAQHIGAPAKALIKKGDQVKMGQKIGEAGGFVSCNIHSSVSGKVVDVTSWPDPLGRHVPTVIIENDGQDEKEYMDEHEDFLGLPQKEIKKIAHEAGLAGMGGATFPTFVKMSPPPDTKIDTFILNGAECEPYLTADHRLMLEMPTEVAAGTALFAKGYGGAKGWIGIENNKPDAIKIMRKHVLEFQLEVADLKTKYPQGAEKQLITAITGREVPSGGLPFAAGCAVQNVGTAVALYEAVRWGKPLYERVVTVSGLGVNEPVNLIVRIGTPYQHLIDLAGGWKTEPGKIISGGPMMGMAISRTDVPVTKGTSGILLFPPEMAKRSPEQPCIGCAMCVDICPVRLIPTSIAKNSAIEKWGEAETLGALDCIECGSCSFICPASRRLLDRIRRAKSEINLLKRKGK